jgi:hypothetical protein
MAPESYCPAHSELMRSLGAVEANQETMCSDMKEIKKLLEDRAKERIHEADSRAEQKLKVKLMWGGKQKLLWAGAMAVISIVTSFFVKKVCP